MAGSGFQAGFHPHLPSLTHRLLAKGLGAGMWFFIMYRMREDGPVLLGWRHPWEAHGHGGHGAHEESHGHH